MARHPPPPLLARSPLSLFIFQPLSLISLEITLSVSTLVSHSPLWLHPFTLKIDLYLSFFFFFFLLPSSPSSVPPLPIALSFTFHLSRSSLIIFILRWRLDGWWRKQTGMSGSSLSPPFFSYIFFLISCHYCAAETRRKGGGDRKSNGKERKKYLKKDGFTKRKRCRK